MSTPVFPGWSVRDDDGLLVAVRVAPLTEYQRLNGARDEVCARAEGELRILVDAHTELAERLAVAERVRPKVRPFARSLRAVEPLEG